MKKITFFVLLMGILTIPIFAQTLTTCSAINAIDKDGKPTFAGLSTTDRYTIEGVVLNNPDTFDGDGDPSFILFVQDETGGLQVYSGSFYGGGLAIYQSLGVKQGDKVRVTGLTGFYGGKTNINDRHNKDNKFEITILGHPGVPAPFVITDLAAATAFDQTQKTGGEYYQGRLVSLKNVRIVSGDWVDDGEVVVADQKGNQLPIVLWKNTGLASQPKPEGWLDITGVFDQEDTEAPHTEAYQVWPRSIADFQASTSAAENWYLFK